MAPESRITVSMNRAADDALGRLTDHSGLSKTEVVNRAVTLYAYVTESQAAGSDLLLRNPEGEVERVRLI